MNPTIQNITRGFTLSLSTKAITMIFSLAYTLIVANALAVGEYGWIVWLMALFGNLSLLVGAQVGVEVLSVWTAKLKSKQVINSVFAYVFIALFAITLLYLALLPQLYSFFGGNKQILLTASALFFLVPMPLLFNAIFWGFKRFGIILKISAIDSFANLAITTALLALGYGVFGVLLGRLLSLIVSSLVSLYYYSGLKFEAVEPDSHGIKTFTENSIITNVLKVGELQVALAYLGLFASTTLLGFYFLVQKITSYVLELPLRTASDVILPFACENEPEKYTTYALKFTLAFLIIVGILFCLFSPLIFVLFPKYSGALFFVPFFALMQVGMLNGVMYNFFRATNKMHLITKIEGISLAIMVVLGYLAGTYMGIIGLIGLQAILQCFKFDLCRKYALKEGIDLDWTPTKKDFVLFWNCIVSEVGSWKKKQYLQ